MSNSCLFVLEPFQAVIGWDMGTLWTGHQSQHVETDIHSPPAGNLVKPINLTCMSLNDRKKPELTLFNMCVKSNKKSSATLLLNPQGNMLLKLFSSQKVNAHTTDRLHHCRCCNSSLLHSHWETEPFVLWAFLCKMCLCVSCVEKFNPTTVRTFGLVFTTSNDFLKVTTFKVNC